MPACLCVSSSGELLLGMTFLLPSCSHPVSTAVPPGECNLDRLALVPPSRLADGTPETWSNDTTARAGVTHPQQVKGSGCSSIYRFFFFFHRELWCSLMRQGSYSETTNSTMKELLYALLQWWLWLPILHNSLSSARAAQTGLRRFLNDECWLERFPVRHNYSALMCNTQWSICISMGISVGLRGLRSKQPPPGVTLRVPQAEMQIDPIFIPELFLCRIRCERSRAIFTGVWQHTIVLSCSEYNPFYFLSLAWCVLLWLMHAHLNL